MPSKTDAQFQAENDLRTLVDANKIRKDSKRMKALKTEAKKQKSALASIDSK